ncbi:aldose epimerase family protein [Stakelama saccharophila]|uniref:Aldose 1-epimerase n=1 Tax=Stakelama saccharophila TaxID=3075605 RepID=A0ABZ0BCN3_9SPHN|nr:aldose epimerase family protein [Stakelama sp. W311]WNO55207.1 aldose epimerase family protein [Stakelama sp. W311]
MKKRTMAGTALALMAVSATAGAAQASEVSKRSFGTLPDGRTVEAVTLSNDHGVSATVITYGAALQALILPDAQGEPADITLGYSDIEDYLEQPQYFGATVGRFANRVARGTFVIDGKTYHTPLNDGDNTLHGGTKGFDKVLWDVVGTRDDDTASVTMRYVSPDGDMGYPGKLTVNATYALDDHDQLTITYTATTTKPTVVNISNHSYWNLSGEGSANGAMADLLTIPADYYTPTDATAIPTGELRAVEGTVFDFRKPRAIGARVRDGDDPQIVYGRGYDHNFVIGRKVAKDIHLMAKVRDPASGRGFELWSNQPGLQFYSGNFLDGTTMGKARKIYREGDAIVLEPQLFPDTPNQPKFGSARLDPGETYRNVIVYKFSTGK